MTRRRRTISINDLETNHWRAYIGEAAQLAWTQDNGLQLLFTLKDRLGSATTLVNQDGQLISRRYFDPFGKSASELPSTLDTVSFGMTLSEFQFTDLTETNRYRRGFTGYEHLNEQQLIHMNGRIYDYNLGRFMSVDPVIQSPANTQSVNPYSYIMNNPLAGTDPTGYRCAPATGSSVMACGSVTTTVSQGGKVIGTKKTQHVNLLNQSEVNGASAKAASRILQNNKVPTLEANTNTGAVDTGSQGNIASVQDATDFLNQKLTSQNSNSSSISFNDGFFSDLWEDLYPFSKRNVRKHRDYLERLYGPSDCSTQECVSPELAQHYIDITGLLLAYPPGKIPLSSSAGSQAASQAIRLSSSEAETILVANGVSKELAAEYTASFSGQITLNVVEKGQVFLRYSNTATDKGSFLTTTRFSSPSAAVDGLYLAPYGDTAQYVQKVTATQRTVVLQGGVANGGIGVNQTLMINREAFKISKGTTY